MLKRMKRMLNNAKDVTVTQLVIVSNEHLTLRVSLNQYFKRDLKIQTNCYSHFRFHRTTDSSS